MHFFSKNKIILMRFVFFWEICRFFFLFKAAILYADYIHFKEPLDNFV